MCRGVVLADAGRCSKSFWDWDFLEDRLKGANPKTGQKSVVLGLTGHTVHSERGQSQNDLGQGSRYLQILPQPVRVLYSIVFKEVVILAQLGRVFLPNLRRRIPVLHSPQI